MKAAIRVCLVAAVLAAAGPPAVHAQGARASAGAITPDTRSEVLDRYRVLVVRDGIVLTPRSGARQAIELTGDGIAIDGQAVSGREVRERLGEDAALILQLSYAGPDELKRAFGPPPAAPEAPPAPGAPAAPEAPAPASEPVPPAPRAPRDRGDEWSHSGGKVRFGGMITVEEGERVSEAVAIGGSVTVRGQVDGDVVAIGGGVHLGPKALVRGGVVTIGGGLRRESGSEVRGDIVELGFGGPWVFAPLAHTGWFGPDMFSDWFRLMGTLLRVALVLLIALVIVAIAERPISRIAARAGDDPWLSGFVGLAAEILFVPILVVTIVFLAISIIGIPLLLLVPFALVALLIGVLMGFAGVARRVGQWVVGGDRSPMMATAVGVVLIAGGAILARLIWLLPGPVWPIAATVGVIGLFLEYVAWTVGLGALLLTRFGTQPAPVPAAWAPPPVPPPPPFTEPIEGERPREV